MISNPLEPVLVRSFISAGQLSLSERGVVFFLPQIALRLNSYPKHREISHEHILLSIFSHDPELPRVIMSASETAASTTAIATTAAVITASIFILSREVLWPRWAKVLRSPLKTTLPRLTQDETNQLVYQPDQFPGARDVETPVGSLHVLFEELRWLTLLTVWLHPRL